jgi:hypothetical protein
MILRFRKSEPAIFIFLYSQFYFIASAFTCSACATEYRSGDAADVDENIELHDSNGDSIADIITDNDIDGICISGPCCHEGLLRNSTYECDNEVIYRCIGDMVCGGVLQRGVKRTYCSGMSPSCDGEQSSDTWDTFMICDVNHACNSVDLHCDLCPIGCNSEGCIPCTWTWDRISCTGDGCPAGTINHAAVWMDGYGSMLVFGGGPSHSDFASLYNPIIDEWRRTTTISLEGEIYKAVWTGSLVIVWGGDGVVYNPITDNAYRIAAYGESSVYRLFSMVWTGSEMIVWGGTDGSLRGTNYGARYNPTTDSWNPTAITTETPSSRFAHSAVWNGDEMIVWGGAVDEVFLGLNNGSSYNPITDSWLSVGLTGECPTERLYHSAIWTGNEMVVWGGLHAAALRSGGLYNTLSDSWRSTAIEEDTPSGYYNSAVWTGKELITWGGLDSGIWLNKGGHYDPTNNEWTPTQMEGAPEARYGHTAIWTGSEMIIWGGRQGYIDPPYIYLNSGYKYRCIP